jgi:hypothetical protein
METKQAEKTVVTKRQPFDLRTVESFEAQVELMLRQGAIPASEQRAFDARKIVTELGPTIQRPKS